GGRGRSLRARARAGEPARAAPWRLRLRRPRERSGVHRLSRPRASGRRMPPIRTVIGDDDFMSASVHRSYTERLPGFTVVGEAHTGAEALALARVAQPDLVLLDIYLPDMTGLEVLRRLRTDSAPVDVIAV